MLHHATVALCDNMDLSETISLYFASVEWGYICYYGLNWLPDSYWLPEDSLILSLILIKAFTE